MYRILALLLILSVVLIGCAAEPTPTPAPTSEPPTEVPTEAPTSAPAVAPTETAAPTIASTDTPAPTATPQPITGTVKSTLNVRDQPTTKGKLLGVLKTNDSVTLVGRTDDKTWVEVNYPLGEQTTGWVIAERIDTPASNIDNLASTAATSPTPATTLVAVQPTSSSAVTSTVASGTPAATSAATAAATTEAGTPAATVGAGTPGTTVAATSVATTTVKATVTAGTPAPAASGGTPPGSILFDTWENGGFNIYKVRADGTGLVELIAGGSDPALSPNGSHIAYRMRKDTGGLGIGLASATGAYESTITQESAAGYPTWSPDGNNIAYNILPNGKLSGQIMRIATGPDNTPSPVGIGVRPAWQGNPGTLIMFDGCKGSGDCGSILTENAYQGDPSNPNLLGVGTTGAWSPNGSQIAFQAQDDKNNTQVFVMNADGSNRHQITTDTGTHGMPIWSSDGAWLFYRTDQGGTGWAIYAVRANGSGAHKIVDSNVNPDEWVYAKLAIAP